MEKEIETMFLVQVHTDGTFTALLEVPETLPAVARQATSFDVFNTSQQIVKEIDTQMLVERIVGTLASVLTPPKEATAADKVGEKLKERKVQPEAAAPTE